jgi:rhodanese-related sulfurtransferase
MEENIVVQTIAPQALQQRLEGHTPFALIDVREAGEHNSAHIPDSSLIPRRQLEFHMATVVPVTHIPVVVYDDNGQRATLAAATLERMGYTQVSVLQGGINWWVTQGYPTEWGSNVISKDFGEKMEVVHHVPEIEATELHARMERGDKLVILDTRTPEEYQRFCIPGGRSVPGGELALRITDITQTLDTDTTVIVNCAGRTRSIIGTRVLQRMGLSNVYGLKNGTSGWMLAGYPLETGGNRLDLPAPSPEGLAAAEAYADRLAVEDGVRAMDIPTLHARLAKRQQDACYCVDVRTIEEYEKGHIPGFRWFPGGQAVQRADEVMVVKHCPIVLACDRKARSTVVASWYRQFGFADVDVLQGGINAWAAAGLALARGRDVPTPFGLSQAEEQVRVLSPHDLQAAAPPVVIFVDTSQDFARGHVPGARWVPRGALEFQMADVAPSTEMPIAVTCQDGANALLAGATLRELGYHDVAVLAGGTVAWQAAGLPLETGLAGVMRPPTDIVLAGPDRNAADAINYLRWETALGEKYHPAS